MKRKEKLIEDIETRKNLDPHAVAEALQTIFNQRDEEGLQKVRSAYIDSLLAGRFRNPTNAAKVVDENLYVGSRLADIVKKDGDVSSGQLMGATNITSGNVGLVAQFYRRTTGYNPEC